MRKKFILFAIIVIVLSVSTAFALTDTMKSFVVEWNPSNKVNTITDNVKSSMIVPEIILEERTLNTEMTVNENYGETSDVFNYSKRMRDGIQDSPQFIYKAPTGIDVDGNKNIYISDPLNECIRVYNSTGEQIKDVSYESVASNKELKDFRTNKNGDIYILFDDSVYCSNNKSSEFSGLVSGFNDAHQLRVSNSGNIYVLDFNYSNLNLRVQKFDANGNLLKIKEQYSYDMGIFDYEDNDGNTINISRLGGNSYDEQQYILTTTKYKGNEYFISFKAGEGRYIRGVSVIGVDDNGNIYFLRKTEKVGIGIEYYIDKYDYVNRTICSTKTEKLNTLPTEGLTKHVIIASYDGSIYQLGSSEDDVIVKSYGAEENIN